MQSVESGRARNESPEIKSQKKKSIRRKPLFLRAHRADGIGFVAPGPQTSLGSLRVFLHYRVIMLYRWQCVQAVSM